MGYVGYSVTRPHNPKGVFHTRRVICPAPMFEGQDGPDARDQQGDGIVTPDALRSAEEGSVAQPSGHGGHRLSSQQLEWARQYVLNGGNATEAARVAGYQAPEKAGYRNTLNASIHREIERLSVAYIGAKLPWLIDKACEIIEDEDADAKARVSAILGLMDRAGLRPKTGPLVQINQQNNTTNINGATAQAAIAEVWTARAARLEARLSDIGGGMSDTSDTLRAIDAIEHAALSAPSAAVGQGGVVRQGPSVSPSQLPPPSSEHPPENAGGRE